MDTRNQRLMKLDQSVLSLFHNSIDAAIPISSVYLFQLYVLNIKKFLLLIG